MKSTPASMAESITLALTRIRAPEALRDVKVEEMPGHGGRIMTPCILVRHAGSPHAHVFDLETDRETLPPACADKVARRLVETHADLAIKAAEHDGVAIIAAPLSVLPDTRPLFAFDEREGGPLTSFSMFADVLSHSLVRRRVRVQRMVTATMHNTAVRMATQEKMRSDMLAAAGGDRRAALTCCPVTARAIVEDPGKWRPKIEEALADDAGVGGFRDGQYRPMVHLGGARWRGSTFMADGEQPETVRAALVGRPLTDFVRHRLIPEGITITGSAQRRGDGEIYVRTDTLPVPMAPILDLLGLSA
jgi:hypothetical protein